MEQWSVRGPLFTIVRRHRARRTSEHLPWYESTNVSTRPPVSASYSPWNTRAAFVGTTWGERKVTEGRWASSGEWNCAARAPRGRSHGTPIRQAAAGMEMHLCIRASRQSDARTTHLCAVRARVEFFHPQPPNRPRPDALNGKAAATAIALNVWSGVELALDSTDGALRAHGAVIVAAKGGERSGGGEAVRW